MRPIPMAEAQKDAQRVTNDGSELSHGISFGHIQVIHRVHETVCQHQQGRLMEVRDQKQEKIFVAELLEVGLAVDKHALAAIPHHRKDTSRAHEPCSRALTFLSVPIAVVAEALFKIA